MISSSENKIKSDYSFPIEHKLKYKENGSSNLERWRFELVLFLKLLYRGYAKVVVDMKVPESYLGKFIPSQDNEDDESLSSEQLKLKMEHDYKFFREEQRGWNNIKGAMITSIIQTLSNESIKKITMAGDTEWKNAILNEDVISVMNQIIEAHNYKSAGTTSTYTDKRDARRDFDNITLINSENISAFNQRFNNMIKKLKDIDILKEFETRDIIFSYLRPLAAYNHKEIATTCIEYLSNIEDSDKFPKDLLELQKSFFNKEHTILQHGIKSKDSNKFTTINMADAELPSEIDLPNGFKLVKDGDVFQVFTTTKSSKKKKKGNKKSDKEKVRDGHLPSTSIQSTHNGNKVEGKGKKYSNPNTEAYIKKQLDADTSLTYKEVKDALKCNKCGKSRHISTDCKESNKANSNQNKGKQQHEKVNMTNILRPETPDSGQQEFQGSFYTSYDVNVTIVNKNSNKKAPNFKNKVDSSTYFRHVSMSKTGIILHDEVFVTSYSNSFESRNNDVDDVVKFTIDGFAGIHLWNDASLLMNVRKVNGRVFVTGVGGAKIEVFEVGDHPLFGEVYICPKQKYNIISEPKARVDSGYYLRISNDNKTKYLYNKELKSVIPFFLEDNTFHRTTQECLLKETRRLFPDMCHMTYNAEIYIAAALYYTVEQQKRAQEAIALHEALGHPSDKALSAYLQSPSNINNHISVQDLRNARDIYGPCPNCLEGKPLPNHGRSTWDPGGKPTTPGQLLHVDIVYINKKPRLFSVDHVSGYMNLIILENKSKLCLERALDSLLNHYQSSLKVVQVISSDYEEVFKSCESHLNSRGVKIALMIPYEHERVAERYMRMVREKMRVKLRELPYTLNPELYDYLAIDCIRLCNIVPNKHSLPYSPLELVHGEKFNFLTDMTATFGYPFLSAAHDSHDPTATNEVGISLGSIKNSKGGILTYIPGRKRLINRRCIKRVPITKLIIDHMNELADIKPGSTSHEEFLFKFQERSEYSREGLEDETSPDFKTMEDTTNTVPTYNSEDNNKEVQEHDSTSNVENNMKERSAIIPALSTSSDKNESIIRLSSNNNNSSLVSSNNNSNNNTSSNNQNDVTNPITSSGESMKEDTSLSLEHNSTRKPTSPIKTKSTVVIDENNLRRSSRSTKGVPAERLANTKHSSINNMSIYTIAEYIQEGLKENHRYYDIFAADTVQIIEALRSEYSKAALNAAEKEILSLIKLKCWRYLNNIQERTPSVHERITPSSMFLKKKYDAKGNFLLWKARLVGGGHRTDHNVYEPLEKHSPTIPSEVAMMQLGQASYEKANVEVFDIPSAYLNAHLAPNKRQLMRFNKSIAEIICKVDPSAKAYIQKDGTLLVEVLRALYGFPESAKLWHEHISRALIKGGYTQCPSEPCLFKKFNKATNEWSVITIFVDDCLHTYKGSKIRNELYKCLKDADIPDPVIQQLTTSNDISYLGINIHLKDKGELFLSQPGFINEIINMYKPRKQYKTPCTEDLFSRSKEELECKEYVDTTEFLSKLMKLMFLARLTRLDILLSVVGLATKSKQPNIYDMERLDRIVGYLLYTKDLGMNIKVTNTKLNAYFDASWNCHPDAKGHSGIIITIGPNGFPVIYKSSKQKIVTRSSTEAELVCDFTGTDILLYARRLWLFLGYGSENEPTDLHQDNTSTITISYMGRGSSGCNSKYMDLKYFWIKDYLDKNIIRMKYLPTDQMIADFFASPRAGAIFKDMRDTIMGYHSHNNNGNK